MNNTATETIDSKKRMSDLLFILWAGGAALLSYSLVYALRKPYTASTYAGLDILGFDYKTIVTITQIIGYLIAKFVGIKLISELKKESRFKFILTSVTAAQLSLVAYGLIPAPYNIAAMFFNGLSLGCMWGVIFSFIEGRRVTDILASLLGISIVVASGTAKSVGLFVTNTLHISDFWMPAFIGAFALPILALLAYLLNKLPHPDAHDKQTKTERVTLDKSARKELFLEFMPVLTMLFIANLLLIVLRDIKEDFLVNIFDTSMYSDWIFAQLDSVVTLIILGMFGLMVFVKNNLKALISLLVMVMIGTVVMTVISFGHSRFELSPLTWLFVQSLCLYTSYLTFQTIFFDRFIACFKIKGNVGFFIALIDFIGYTGTVAVLLVKEFCSPNIDWLVFYNNLAGYVGIVCCISFAFSIVYIVQRHRKENGVPSFTPAYSIE